MVISKVAFHCFKYMYSSYIVFWRIRSNLLVNLVLNDKSWIILEKLHLDAYICIYIYNSVIKIMIISSALGLKKLS